MNPLVTIDTAAQPSYAERRAAMADETRTRILEACTAILARGVTELSIPAVAREAGVSVPTVYRHFPDKRTLVEETANHLRRLRRPARGGAPRSLDAWPDEIKQQFEASASLSETVRMAIASEPILAVRRETGEREERLGGMAQFLDGHGLLQDRSPRDRELAVLVASVLCSSATLRAFREVAGSTPAEAAEAVTWALTKILDHDLSAPRGRKRTKGGKR